MNNVQGAIRRTDLDWVRIGAFLILILYHVGVVYAPGPNAVGSFSPRPLPWLVVPMTLVNPWRLLVLFVVSGAATRFMSDKMSPRALLRSRSARLLIPFIFGVWVVVPPQCFVQAVERCGYSDDYLQFWQGYLVADQHLCTNGPHFVVPTPNHLWFVGYLWVLTALLALMLAIAPHLLVKLQRWIDLALAGRGLFIWPACWLALAYAVLQRGFPFWYGFAIYVPAFLFGFLVATSNSVWQRFAGVRWQALAGAAFSYCALIGLALAVLGTPSTWAAKVTSSSFSAAHLVLHTLGSAVYGINQWLWMAVVFGFAYQHLRGRDGPIRRYLTDAIFPFYIIHQTTIEVVAHYLSEERLALGLEATLLICVTVVSCFATYEIARRFRPLRPLFGLKGTDVPGLPLAPLSSVAFTDTH
ncbi:MAG TPA: acyltransferase family protein [Steroidobacteraceae bacterium]